MIVRQFCHPIKSLLVLLLHFGLSCALLGAIFSFCRHLNKKNGGNSCFRKRPQMTAVTFCARLVITDICGLQGAPQSESSHDFREFARSDSPSYKRGLVSRLTSAAADLYAHSQLWIKGKRSEKEVKVLHDGKGHAAVCPHLVASLELFLFPPSLSDTSAVFFVL